MVSSTAWHFYVNTAISTEQNIYRKSPTVNLFNTIGKSVLNSFYSSSSIVEEIRLDSS